MPILTINRRADAGGGVLFSRDVANDAALLTHCAANGIDLTRADLSGRTWDGANISGLIAPKSDLRNASLRNVVADRLVAGRTCELSGSMLTGAIITSSAFTHANLACCSSPLGFRVEPGPSLRLRGCDWGACPDVLELPISRAERTRTGKALALRNGTGWRVHAGERGVLTEAQAKVTLAALPEYAAAMAWLDTPEATAAKAAIDARPAGSGTVTKPSAGDGDAKVAEGTGK